MRAIVDGLRPEYGERITLRYVDTETTEGQQLLKQFGFRGHPSSAITATDGTVLWTQVGGMNEAKIRAKLEEFAKQEG